MLSKPSSSSRRSCACKCRNKRFVWKCDSKRSCNTRYLYTLIHKWERQIHAFNWVRDRQSSLWDEAVLTANVLRNRMYSVSGNILVRHILVRLHTRLSQGESQLFPFSVSLGLRPLFMWQSKNVRARWLLVRLPVF